MKIDGVTIETALKSEILAHAFVKIFNDVFSKSVVVIIENTLGQVASLALGTIVIGAIFIIIYAARETYKSLKQKEVSSERKI